MEKERNGKLFRSNNEYLRRSRNLRNGWNLRTNVPSNDSTKKPLHILQG